MLLRIVYLITLMIVSLPSLSLEVKAKDSLVERYLDLSNQGEDFIKWHLKSVGNQMIQRINTNLPIREDLKTKKTFNEIQNEIKVFVNDPSTLANNYNLVKKAFIEGFSEHELEELIEWIENPKIKKIVQFESEVYDSNFNNDMQRYNSKFPSNEKISNIENFLYACDCVFHIVENELKIISDIMSELPVREGNNSVEKKDEVIKYLRSILTMTYEEAYFEVYKYVFRETPVEDINLYAKFYRSALGKKEAQISAKSSVSIQKNVVEEFFKIMSKYKENTK